MPDDKTERPGVMSTCRRCGSKNIRTGRTRTEDETASGSEPFKIRSAEYRCTGCGVAVWAQESVEEGPVK